MQRHIAILLLLCLHIQPAANFMVWVDFLANNTYIKEVLCINKDKTELQCEGKCYLMQRLQKQQREQQQEFPQLVHIKYEFLLAPFQEKNRNLSLGTLTRHNFPSTQKIHTYLEGSDIFHPPRV